MRITDEMKEKTLGGDDAHGGRGNLEPAAPSVLAEFIEDPYASGRFENLGCQGIPADVYNELLRVAADKHVSVYYLAAIYKRGQAEQRTAQSSGTSPDDIHRRCRAAAERFEALAGPSRIDAVVSADLLLEAASLLRGYSQVVLLEALPNAKG